jgi:hypothetical protein
MTAYSEKQLEQEIQALWMRRDRLSNLETKRLYLLVSGFLKGKNLSHYAKLQHCIINNSWDDLKSQLIDDFYTDVIYCRSLADSYQATPLNHCGALLSYYKNYLIDRIRRCQQERKAEDVLNELIDQKRSAERSMSGRREMNETSAADDQWNNGGRGFDDDSGCDRLMELNGSDGLEQTEILDEESATDLLAQDDFISTDPLQDDSPCDEKKARTIKIDERSYAFFTRLSDSFGGDDDLEAAELTRTILPAAVAFLDAAERKQQACGEPLWILLYLANHFCQAETDDRISLSTLRDRYGIRSHHVKARQLGITSALGGFPSFDDFAQTLLGQWLQGLGIAITRENQSEIRTALKILCRAALDRVKADDGH